MEKYKKLKSNKAITLIALIITIVIMLILVGVVVNIAIEGDIIGTTENAVDKWNDKVKTEQNDIDEMLEIFDNIIE